MCRRSRILVSALALVLVPLLVPVAYAREADTSGESLLGEPDPFRVTRHPAPPD